MPLDLHAALTYLVETGGSDLHLKAGSPPLTRIDGALRPIDGLEILSPEDTEAVVHEMLHDQTKLREFTEEHEVDFSYAIEGLARFRVNAFRQRGHVSVVMPCDPDLDPHDRRPEPAARSCATSGRGGARHRAADRHDRLGQVDDARRDDRPHQLRPAHGHIVTIEDPIEFLHEDKRSLINQREVGQRHRVVQARAAPRAAPGPGRDPDRRDARRGDGRRRRCPRPRPATSSSRTVHTVDAAETVNRMIDFFPPHHAPAGPRDARRDAEGRDLPAARAVGQRRAVSPPARSCG